MKPKIFARSRAVRVLLLLLLLLLLFGVSFLNPMAENLLANSLGVRASAPGQSMLKIVDSKIKNGA